MNADLGDDGTVQATERILVVPTSGLVVLVGASGAGKTSFAARHFAPTEVLSSDAFRALVGDDEADQSATAAAFDVLGRVLAHRLQRGRLSVVDATNVTTGARRTLLQLADTARRPVVAIVLDLPEAVCQERNARRAGRVVEAAVVRRQVHGVRRTVADPERLLSEGFAAVHILDDPAAIEAVSVVRDPSLRARAVSGSRAAVLQGTDSTKARVRRSGSPRRRPAGGSRSPSP